ncbi:acetate kinase [Galbibacter sp. EGI 63066]|uniref:acetate/propionate family kinase n=1 Tax=Galbibacter sp. EGI 63066 TaxID=2993559 RepID=UPI00224922D2|nr:acetate kinase [Galbibacter sp. EGI 63066]MCX2680148.1 acetate kinase [Galbibacter sp. EGI 63066]
MKKILVINSGSSSIKFQLIRIPGQIVQASGLVERIGLDNSAIHYKSKKMNIADEVPIPNHEDGLKRIAKLLMDSERGAVNDMKEIDAVGHRVVHGGKEFADTIVIDGKVKNAIKELFPLAPLHNPHNYTGIEVAESVFPDAIQVAVFDTAFHQTLPEKAYKYAVPNKFLDEDNIRVYGFHGTSHRYVAEKALDFISRKESKLITIHLGNGCSITAVKNGKSIDHSLGFAPVNGLIMGTRSGDIDQSIIFYMVKTLGYSLEEVSELLHKKSGMLGLTGYSDLREIEEQAEKGNKECQLALVMNAYRIKKYIGAYAAALNGVDALVFTAGIGENSSVLRRLVCEDMDYLGIELEDYKNNVRSTENRIISKETSKVMVLVIPTNEELEIAKQTYELIS